MGRLMKDRELTRKALKSILTATEKLHKLLESVVEENKDPEQGEFTAEELFRIREIEWQALSLSIHIEETIEALGKK